MTDSERDEAVIKVLDSFIEAFMLHQKQFANEHGIPHRTLFECVYWRLTAQMSANLPMEVVSGFVEDFSGKVKRPGFIRRTYMRWMHWDAEFQVSEELEQAIADLNDQLDNAIMLLWYLTDIPSNMVRLALFAGYTERLIKTGIPESRLRDDFETAMVCGSLMPASQEMYIEVVL